MDSEGGPQRGRKPTKVVNVPPEQRLDGHINIKAFCDSWNKETECVVEPIFRYGRLNNFNLFGSKSEVDAATRKINKWLQQVSTKTVASSAWAKLEAFDHNKWWYQNYAENEEVWKQQFLGTLLPENYGEFPVTAIVVWPQVLAKNRVSPRDAFGNKLEVLDPIRLEDEVFIRLLPSMDPWQIEIRGDDPERVDAAEFHCKNHVHKVYTKRTSRTMPVNIILDASEGKMVRLRFADQWWPHNKGLLVPQLIPDSLLEVGTFRTEPVHPQNLASIEHGLRLALSAIMYEKGSYSFAIRLGCLALQGSETLEEIKKKIHAEKCEVKYDVRSFKKSVEGNVDCAVQKWLADDNFGKTLLERLMRGTHLLEPTKSGYFGIEPSSLKETRPTFRGTWALRDPNSFRAPRPNDAGQPGAPSLIIIQIEWTEDEEGAYEKMAPCFYKLKEGKSAPLEHMDVNLLELGDSKAWGFNLESMTLVAKSTVSPAIVAFADSIKMKNGYGNRLDSVDVFAQWNKTPSINIFGGRLEQIYTFGIKRTGYKVQAIKMWYPGAPMPCWGLAVRHREWDMHLGELERLPPGRCAEWDDVIKTFFPDNGQSASEVQVQDQNEGDKLLDIPNLSISHGQGVRLLVSKLLQLSSLINSDGAPPPTPSLGANLIIKNNLLD